MCACSILQSFSETLVRLALCVYRDLTGNDSDRVPLPWLYVVNKYMHDNHQLFFSLYDQNKDCVIAGEATKVRFIFMGFSFSTLKRTQSQTMTDNTFGLSNADK